jgi:hypothetical protein
MTIIETEQSRETKFTEIARGPFILRFISYRKSEDAKLNLRSEDYIVSELNPDKAVFALCDGVGSSFYGDIGSQILGETLLDWLSRVSPPNNFMLGKSESANQWIGSLSKNLHAELKHKTELATTIIQKKEINSQDELTKLAEETQRDDFGTQSNFASGILWPKSPSRPNGLILLFWLGNARLRIYNKNTDLTHLLGWGNDPDQLREVWSSKDGVVGRIYSYITDLSKITTVIAYSDGLENAEDRIRPNLNGVQLEALVNQAQSIKDDDVTYLELSTIEGEVAGISDDIVSLFRKSTPSSLPQSDPDSDKLKQKFDTLQKKYDEQTSTVKRNQLVLIALIIGLSMLCFSAGFLLSPVVGSILNPTPTATATPSPTVTPSLTPSPSATSTNTETPTATLTLTNTETLSPTPTNSSTPTLTSIPSTAESLTPALTASPGP